MASEAPRRYQPTATLEEWAALVNALPRCECGRVAEVSCDGRLACMAHAFGVKVEAVPYLLLLRQIVPGSRSEVAA